MPDHQPAPRERQPQPRNGEGAQRDERLVGQAGQTEQWLSDMAQQLGAPGPEMKSEAALARLAQQQRRRAQQRREAQHRQREASPRRAGDGADRPARDQQPGEHRREEAPADVVEDLPLAQQGEAHAAPADARRPGPQPREDLPVAAHPAVLAADVAEIGRGHVLVDFHAAQQRGTRVGALQQVMAEDNILRKAAVQRLPEGVHIVNALAHERALAEKVLVNVGDFPGVGVQPGLPAHKARIEAAVSGEQAHRHARLQDRVSLDDASRAGIETRAVERVRQRADHLRRCAARQVGVRVEGDHIAYGAGRRHLASNETKGVAGLAAQQRVEMLQFAALALVAHPAALAGVPDAGAVEQVENGGAVGTRMARVETRDCLARLPQQRIFAGKRLRFRVREIGQQGKIELRVAIAQIANLHSGYEAFDSFGFVDNRGYNHESAVSFRNAAGEVEPRQRVGRHDERHEEIDKRDRQRRGGHGGGERQQPEGRRRGGQAREPRRNGSP